MKKAIILIAIILSITAGLFVASADPSGTKDYQINITQGQNTVLTTIDDGNFGNLLSGAISYKNNTFNLTNTGNAAASISAKFLTNGTGNNSGVYGLVSGGGTYVIPGNSFELESTSSNAWFTLTSNSSAAEALTANNVAKGGVAKNWDIKVTIPSDQEPVLYTGTLQITFQTVYT